MRELIAAAYPGPRHPGRGAWPRPDRRRVRLGARPDRRHQVVHHRPPAVRHADRAGASGPPGAGHDRPVDPARALGRRRRAARRPGTAGRSGCGRARGSRTRCCSRPARAMFRAGPENEAFDRVQRRVRLPMYGGDCYAYGLLAMGFADLVVEASLQPYDFMALVPVIEGAGGRAHRLAGPAAWRWARRGRWWPPAIARVHAAALRAARLTADGAPPRYPSGRARH